MSKSLKVIFAGTPNFAACHLNALIFFGYKIICVITQPDNFANRGKKLVQNPVKILAKKKEYLLFNQNLSF